MDLIPTSILKDCVDNLRPLTHIVNPSLSLSQFPDCLKFPTVTQLLKNPSFERKPKIYRPVSNLSFLSKLLDQVTIDQLDSHFNNHNLFDPNQFAFRSSHSTERALIKIINDILRELDQGNVVYMALLDLSSAFDTMDDEVLVECLSRKQGISDDALKWIKFFFKGRTQNVNALCYISEKALLSCGVPQGSECDTQIPL